jgi:hypothetical protein
MFDVFIQAAVKVQYLRCAGFDDEVFAVHAVNDYTPVSSEVEELGFDVTCFHRRTMMEWKPIERADWEEAQHKARSEGADGASFISDKWGGYWQANTKYGPYTFRTASCVPLPPPPVDKREHDDSSRNKDDR